MSIESASRQLERALLSTNEFAELKNAKRVIDKNPKSKEAVDNFYKKQQLVYEGNLSRSQTQNLMEDINSDYQKLSAILEIKRYFVAMDNFNNLLGQIMNNLHYAIDESLKLEV